MGAMSRWAAPRRGVRPAQVAMSEAFSIRKSAAGTPASVRLAACVRTNSPLDGGSIEPADHDALGAASLTADDRQRALRDVEDLGEDVEQLRVRGAFDRRGVQADEKGIVARARQARTPGPPDYRRGRHPF